MRKSITLQILTLLLVLLFFNGCDHTHHAIKKQAIGNIELAYYIRGHGEPLIMIMGFRGTMAVWDPALLDRLAKNFTLILFDNRGTGLSSDSAENVTTIPQMAEDTAQLIKSIGYSKVNVLGWSMGSRIALQLALKYPEMVSNLILCSPNPGGAYQSPRTSNAYQQLTATNFPQKQILSLIFPATFAGRQASSLYLTRLSHALADGTVPNDLKMPKQTVDRQIQALMLWDKDNYVYQALPNLHVPTLVSTGLEDILDPPRNANIIANRIPFAWIAYFPHAGHNFISQDYMQFSNLVSLFVATNKN